MSAPSTGAEVFARISAPDQARRLWLKTAARAVTYGELSERVRRMAGLLAARGIAPGDRVVLAGDDEAEVCLTFCALVLNGVTAILLESESGPDRALGLTRKADPKLILVERALNAAWALNAPGAEVIEIVPAAKAGALSALLGKKTASEGLSALLDAAEPRDPPAAIDPETLAYILFTSGTTQAPKGVEISHRALFAHLATLGRVFGYAADSRILNTLMLSHADGIVQGPLVAMTHGAALYRPLRFEVSAIERLLDAVYQLRITHMVCVPTMLALFTRLASHQRDAFAGGDFQLMISCAAALEPDLWRATEETFGVEVLNMYGLTETVTGGLFKRGCAKDGKYGAAGRPIDCETRIAEDGELLFRGRNLMSGYFRDPANTAEVLQDGWLHTGDVARIDAEGDHWILGRKKSIIIRGGLNIHPEEISEVLNAHPAVKESVAFGEPDADWGETVTALVAAGPGVDDAALRAWCLGKLEPRKIPGRIVLVEALPRGRSGKVTLPEARALAARAGAADADAAEIPAGGDQAARLIAIAARCFKCDPSRLSLTSEPADVLGWDSLAHLELVMAVEAEFGVKLTPRQIMTLDRLDKVLACLPPA